MNFEFEIDDSVEITDDRQAIVLRWSEAGEYDISLNTITDYRSLVWWIYHLSSKSWPGMTPARIGLFITKVCSVKGWERFAGDEVDGAHSDN